jgi:hypothetical protein
MSNTQTLAQQIEVLESLSPKDRSTVLGNILTELDKDVAVAPKTAEPTRSQSTDLFNPSTIVDPKSTDLGMGIKSLSSLTPNENDLTLVVAGAAAAYAEHIRVAIQKNLWKDMKPQHFKFVKILLGYLGYKMSSNKHVQAAGIGIFIAGASEFVSEQTQKRGGNTPQANPTGNVTTLPTGNQGTTANAMV